MTPFTDLATLLANARDGLPGALDALFEALRPCLVHQAQDLLTGGMRTKMSASDLVQETLVEAHTAFPRFEGRTAADNATVRNVYVIGPDKKIKLVLSYPMSTGRNFDEVLRVIDSMQLTARHKVATPVNWKNGDDVIILPAVSDEDARKTYPEGWNAPRPYLRIVPQPKV